MIQEYVQYLPHIVIGGVIIALIFDLVRKEKRGHYDAVVVKTQVEVEEAPVEEPPIEEDFSVIDKITDVLNQVLIIKYGVVKEDAFEKAFDIRESLEGIEVDVKIRGLSGLVIEGIVKAVPNEKVIINYKKPM
jgi:hypothetical protein